MRHRAAGEALDSDGFIGLIRTVADAWRNLDVEAAVDCFTPDAVYMEPPTAPLD